MSEAKVKEKKIAKPTYFTNMTETPQQINPICKEKLMLPIFRPSALRARTSGFMNRRVYI
jgi:hypothetical protein